MLALVAVLAVVQLGDDSTKQNQLEGLNRKPNIVFILADDLGFSDIGCYGGEIATPNLDQLAQQGLRFTQMYNTARCWPTRASVLSGYYPQQVNRDPQGPRPAFAALLPALIKPQGFRSYLSGKWHVDGEPLKDGFDHAYQLEDHDRNFNPGRHILDGKQLPAMSKDAGYYSTTAITNHALDFLKEHQEKFTDQPFFLYLAYTVPHFPLHAPKVDVAKYLGKYKQGWDKTRAARLARLNESGIYQGTLSERTPGVPAWDSLSADEQTKWDERMAVHAAMVDRMDQEIGRLFAKLKDMNCWDNTLIVFASDNGASAERVLRGDGHNPKAPPGSAETFLCMEPGWANAANTPFRLSKIWVHEGGIATPFIMSWPNRIKDAGKLRTTPCHLIDFVPTVLDMLGMTSPNKYGGKDRPPLPGKSLANAFDSDRAIERPFLYWHHQGNRAFRVGNWKLVWNSARPANERIWELYDLKSDRAEMNDLASKEPARVKQMSSQWAETDALYRKQSGMPIPTPNATKKKTQKKKAG